MIHTQSCCSCTCDGLYELERNGGKFWNDPKVWLLLPRRLSQESILVVVFPSGPRVMSILSMSNTIILWFEVIMMIMIPWQKLTPDVKASPTNFLRKESSYRIRAWPMTCNPWATPQNLFWTRPKYVVCSARLQKNLLSLYSWRASSSQNSCWMHLDSKV